MAPCSTRQERLPPCGVKAGHASWGSMRLTVSGSALAGTGLPRCHRPSRRPERQGARFAGLVRLLRRLAPDRQVQLIGHSMGARVALAALPALCPGDVGRIVLLTGAEFTRTARAALTSPARRHATVLNVTSRENDLFDFLAEWLLPAPAPGERVIGAGLAAPNVIDLQLDNPDAEKALDRLGFCHPGCPQTHLPLVNLPARRGVSALPRIS